MPDKAQEEKGKAQPHQQAPVYRRAVVYSRPVTRSHPVTTYHSNSYSNLGHSIYKRGAEVGFEPDRIFVPLTSVEILFC